ncbi:MAG: MFS transporter [Planctomycetes bacterium]|nr:MFS transporter [Planctomycetota bacterium]
MFRLADVWLLFTTRVVRLFAYGFMSVMLVLYLAEVGLSEQEIGLLLTMTLIGDTGISLWITTRADRIGRKRMLIAGAALMVLGGLVFALTSNFWLLLLAATVGVLSPSGNEVGPFLAIEQAALAETVEAEQRTRIIAWYHLAGSFATAAGSLVCGLLLQLLQAHGVRPLESFRVILFSYAAAGSLLGVLFLRLSTASEAAALEPTQAPDEIALHRGLFGLHRSRGVVLKLSALFALDSFAGGFVLQSFVAFWFHVRFGADPATLGGIFFGANLLAGISALAATAIARRVGLLNTMVFTHVPSNLLLVLVPFMPTLPLAVTVLLLRFAISQMDVPARQSYTAAIVSPDERSAAAGITGVARTTGAALAPVLAGLLLSSSTFAGGLFVVAGVLKLIYDGLLYRLFRGVIPPEEVAKHAVGGDGPK